MAWLLILILPFVLSLVLCRILMAVSVKDAPDGGRKVQSQPVPTAGGLAILAGIAVPLLAIAFLSGASPMAIASGIVAVQPYGSWVIVVVALGLLGALDDIRNLPALLKLGVLLAVCVGAAMQLPSVALPLPGWVLGAEGGEVSGGLMIALLALWILVFTNAANFMDGADGLAFGCLAIMFAGIAVGMGIAYRPMLEYLDPTTRVMLLTPAITIMAIAGFLIWNVRGKLYAGDAGALALGGLFAVLAAYTGAYVGIWYPLVLALPFLVDVGMTLIFRAVRRQPLMSAHRDHAYQLFIRRGASPLRVAILWWGFSIVSLIAAISILVRADPSPFYGMQVFLGLSAMGAGLWIWQRIALRSRKKVAPTEPVKLSPERPSREEFAKAQEERSTAATL